MSDYTDEGDVRDVMGALWRRKVTVAVTAALFVGIAAVGTSRQDPVYEARATVLVDPVASSLADPGRLQGRDPGRLLSNEGRFLESDTVRDAVAGRLGVERADVPEVETALGEGDDTMRITAEGADAEEAALVANTFADVYLELRQQAGATELATARAVVGQRIAEIDGQLDLLGADPAFAEIRNLLLERRREFQRTADDIDYRSAVNSVRAGVVLERAEPAEDPVRPKMGQNLTIATIVGLIAGFAVALVRDSVDRTVRVSPIGPAAVPGGAPLAVIPPARGRRVPGGAAAQGSTAEAYRSLRLALETGAADRPLRVIQVVSPNEGPLGAATVRELGLAFHRAGHRVLLVSADLRVPRLHSLCGIPLAPGLAGLLTNDVAVPEAIHALDGDPALSAVAAGARGGEAVDLLSSKRVSEIFEQFREQAEVVLVESAAVLPYADSLELARVVDVTVLVARAGRTKRSDLRRAAELLDSVGAPVVGTVLHGR